MGRPNGRFAHPIRRRDPAGGPVAITAHRATGAGRLGRERFPTDGTPGLREAEPLTHVEALDWDRVPEHPIVLGGGDVGLELAQAFRRLGSCVTVIERPPTLIHHEDPDVSDAMGELFADEGIAVSTNTVLGRVAARSNGSSARPPTRALPRFVKTANELERRARAPSYRPISRPSVPWAVNQPPSVKARWKSVGWAARAART